MALVFIIFETISFVTVFHFFCANFSGCGGLTEEAAEEFGALASVIAKYSVK